MTDAVNAGGRLDRLPIGRFHYRIIWLIGVGMFFDGFDIYTAGTVLGAQRLVSQPLMGGVLVHHHQAAIGGDRQDVGVEHLRHRGAQGVAGPGARRC